MTEQREAYLNGLGDDWFSRNKDDLGKNADSLMSLLKYLKVGPMERILEVGCANGWRGKGVKAAFGGELYGIDPSAAAINEAGADNVGTYEVGTADKLPYSTGSMSLVIMSYCMWAIDPREWLAVVAETDRVLKEGGLLAIIDRFACRPLRKAYPGRTDVFGYAYDWSKLWLCHPAYSEVSEAMAVYPDTLTIEGTCLLQKNTFRKIMTAKEVPNG